jgi:hypothetical protein
MSLDLRMVRYLVFMGACASAGCPAGDDGETAAETGSTEGTGTGPATSSADTSTGATDDGPVATESGSGSGAATETGVDTEGPTCADLACDGDCLQGDDCWDGESICVVPATTACTDCMAASCAEVPGADDRAAIDVANTIGNCYDGEGDALAACLEANCADACEGPFIATCLCV